MSCYPVHRIVILLVILEQEEQNKMVSSRAYLARINRLRGGIYNRLATTVCFLEMADA